jgi:hypothetical protein
MSTTKRANSTLPAATLDQLFDKLDALARSSGLIQRHSRKFSAQGFLLTLFRAICIGDASFQNMAVSLSRFQSASMARQSLHQRFTEKAVHFLQLVLALLVSERKLNQVGNRRFNRILLQDSTQIWMNRKNAGHYRAVANNGGNTAGAKVDLVMDLQSGDFIKIQEVEAYTQDRSLGPDLLELVMEGDLIIRDLGYFDVSGFQRIEDENAHWISRLHGTADVVVASGGTLENHLQSSSGSVLDLEVFMTAKKHRARLIAIRLPEEIANERRRKKKDKRKRNGTSPKKGTLIREGWNLYVTNLDSTECSVEELVGFYEQRWQIEIQFRSIKQSTDMKRAMQRITNRHHLQSLVYTAMIFATLSVSAYQLIASKMTNPNRLSLEKTARWFSQMITSATQPVLPISYDLRHLLHDKRKRRTLKELSTNLLSLN